MGVTKWRYEHRLDEHWVFPTNYLGCWIKQEVIAAQAQYLAYKNSAEGKPITSQIGRQWAKLKDHALSLKNTWMVNSPELFQKVYDRVQRKIVTYPGKAPISDFPTKYKMVMGPAMKKQRSLSSSSGGSKAAGHTSRYDDHATGYSIRPVSTSTVVYGGVGTAPQPGPLTAALSSTAQQSTSAPHPNMQMQPAQPPLGGTAQPNPPPLPMGPPAPRGPRQDPRTQGQPRGSTHQSTDGVKGVSLELQDKGQAEGGVRTGAAAGAAADPGTDMPQCSPSSVSFSSDPRISEMSPSNSAMSISTNFSPGDSLGARSTASADSVTMISQKPTASIGTSTSSPSVSTGRPSGYQRDDLRGLGLLSHPKIPPLQLPGTHESFWEWNTFSRTQGPTVDIRVIQVGGADRRANSKCNPVLTSMKHKYQVTVANNRETTDWWPEYRDPANPLLSGVFKQPDPVSLVDPEIMICRPRILDSRSYHPHKRVAGISGNSMLQPIARWKAYRPAHDLPYLPRLPNYLHIPIYDIRDSLEVISRLEVNRVCNIAFMGDSTLPGVVNPLKEWFSPFENIKFAPKFGTPTCVFGPGKTMFEIFNIPPVDSTSANFFVFKFQNDFLNLFGISAPDESAKEQYLDMGLRNIKWEIEHLITLAQTHCMGASLIFVWV